MLLQIIMMNLNSKFLIIIIRSPNKKNFHKRFPSNSSTVVKGFFHPEVEMVKKLKFFIPQSEKIYERNKSMYNPNISKDEAAISIYLNFNL